MITWNNLRPPASKHRARNFGCAHNNTSLSMLILLAVALLLFSEHFAFAQAPDEMPVKVSVKLCPEYPYGGVTVKLFYSLAEDAYRFEAKVRSLTVEPKTNIAQAEILLPRAYGTTPLNIQAVCENNKGLGDGSKKVPVSNCDYLALLDSDNDGLNNAQEDSNCDNFFSPGDKSNPDNVDTDGDGVRDMVEVVSGTDPTNPGSSPRPYVFSSTPFDPDGDGESNPVVWRPSNGTWYIKDFQQIGKNASWQFGLPGDIPFTYTPRGGKPDVGVIRRDGTSYLWYFHGLGFEHADGRRSSILSFGIFGDNIVQGNWESPDYTSPGVSRLVNNHWYFYFLKRDGTIGQSVWGGNGDVPKVQDYDGDGIFDVAVFRPSLATTYVFRSKNHQAGIYRFGSGSADHTVRGDVTGDRIGDIAFWEPLTALFTVLKSDSDFSTSGASTKSKNAYQELKLGTYFVTVPLSWNMHKGKTLLTVVDHQKGIRSYRENNDPLGALKEIQWGLPGDSQG